MDRHPYRPATGIGGPVCTPKVDDSVDGASDSPFTSSHSATSSRRRPARSRRRRGWARMLPSTDDPLRGIRLVCQACAVSAPDLCPRHARSLGPSGAPTEVTTSGHTGRTAPVPDPGHDWDRPYSRSRLSRNRQRAGGRDSDGLESQPDEAGHLGGAGLQPTTDRRGGDAPSGRTVERESRPLGDPLEPLADEDRMLVGRDGTDLVVRVRADRHADRLLATSRVESVELNITYRYPNGSVITARHCASATLKG
jgi:hypothetical protein